MLIEDYRQDYNRSRPHRGLGVMIPAAFKDGWQTTHEAARQRRTRRPLRSPQARHLP